MGQTTSPDAQELTRPVRDRGSFRDPSGFVYHLGDRIFRAIDPDCSSIVRRLQRTGLLDKLQHRGRLVETRIVRPDEDVYATLRRHIPQAEDFLQHRRIEFISYPYEWSPAMLADAAVCCLDLQLMLIEDGHSLKDASAYNVQFVKGEPVFIDVPSIETVRRRDIWTAMNQFYRMFLHPLLLCRYRRCSLKEYFVSNIDGADHDDIYRRFGGFFALRPALLLDVWLPHQLQRIARPDGGRLRKGVERDQPSAKALVLNLKRLKRKIGCIASQTAPSGQWLDYAENNSYDAQSASRKRACVADFLAEHRPQRVLDIGCNTGCFAELAAEHGSAVVAIDPDAACIDALHRRTRDNGLNVLPLVMDIANPSPGVGFRNVERSPFLDRASFDCVFALAVVHHLLVTNRLPLESIRDLLADLTVRHLVIEFVEPADPMFVSLLGARENIYGTLTLDHFLSVFRGRFDPIKQTRVSTHRTLLTFARRCS